MTKFDKVAIKISFKVCQSMESHEYINKVI